MVCSHLADHFPLCLGRSLLGQRAAGDRWRVSVRKDGGVDVVLPLQDPALREHFQLFELDRLRVGHLLEVAEAPWSVAERAVAPRFDNPRATVPVLVLG